MFVLVSLAEGCFGAMNSAIETTTKQTFKLMPQWELNQNVVEENCSFNWFILICFVWLAVMKLIEDIQSNSNRKSANQWINAASFLNSTSLHPASKLGAKSTINQPAINPSLNSFNLIQCLESELIMNWLDWLSGWLDWLIS